MNRLDGLEEWAKELARYLGIGNITQVSCYENFESGKLIVQFAVSIDRDVYKAGVTETIKTSFKPLVEAIAQSPLVQDEKLPLELEIKQLISEREALQKRIAELEPFEAHFKLELKLRHGPKTDHEQYKY